MDTGGLFHRRDRSMMEIGIMSFWCRMKPLTAEGCAWMVPKFPAVPVD